MIKVFRSWLDRYFPDEEAVLLALLLVLSLLVIATLGVVLAPMITAIIIAFLMQGLVSRLKSVGVPHVLAVSITFLILVSCLALGLLVLLPALWHQLVSLFSEAPRMIREGRELLLLLPDRYPHLVGREQITQLTNAAGTELAYFGQRMLSFSLGQLPVVVGILIYLVLVPILVFFFLKDSRVILAWCSNMLPKERPVMRKIWQEMNQQIANYVRGKFIEILIVAMVSAVTFRMLGLSYALLLGIIVGLSVLVPYIGAAVVTLPIALIAFFQWGWGGDFIWVMVAYAIIQALDGNVLVPLLFSEAVKIHPVMIVLAVLVFGGLWGFWGVFFAIPLATLCKAVVNAWPTRSHQEKLAAAESTAS